MRKALIGLILAATALTPVAAWAQEEDNDGNRRGWTRGERSEQRQQARAERSQQQQAQPQQAPAEQAQPQARVERSEARQTPRGDVQRSDVARERNRGQWGEARRTERSQGAWGDAQRNQQATEQQSRRSWRRGTDSGETAVNQRSTAYPDAWLGDPNDPQRRRYEERERRNQYRYGTTEQRQDVRREWQDRGEWRDDRDGRRDRDWRRNWDRVTWRSDRRYDWQSWRYRNRSLFRLSPYYSPYRNHRYSRFSIGLFLEPLFYSQRYWLDDPFQYRLPYAPPGTRWVRYYNDVILVDTWSGEVVDVIYNFFW